MICTNAFYNNRSVRINFRNGRQLKSSKAILKQFLVVVTCNQWWNIRLFVRSLGGKKVLWGIFWKSACFGWISISIRSLLVPASFLNHFDKYASFFISLNNVYVSGLDRLWSWHIQQGWQNGGSGIQHKRIFGRIEDGSATCPEWYCDNKSIT